jgi:hypothetical protein
MHCIDDRNLMLSGVLMVVIISVIMVLRAPIYDMIHILAHADLIPVPGMYVRYL